MSANNLVKAVATDCHLDENFLQTTTDEINELYSEVISLGRQLASTVYKIGGLILSVTSKMGPTRSFEWLDTLPFSENTAKNYVALYVFFNAREHELEDLTIMQAYAMAGISGKKELAAPETAELIDGEEILDAIETDETETQAEIQKHTKRLFRLKPISGLALKKHRVCLEGSRFFVWTKSGKNRLVADLLIANDGSSSVVTLATNLQIEIEKYLATLEENGDVLI